MNCTASLTSKLAIPSTVENSTYIPIIGAVSSFVITGIALKTMYSERSYETVEKTLTYGQQGELALYNIVNMATLGAFGTCFGIVKLAVWLGKAACSCLAKKETPEPSTPVKSTDLDITEEVRELTPVKTSKKHPKIDLIEICARLIIKINNYNSTIEEKQDKIDFAIEQQELLPVENLKKRLSTFKNDSEVMEALNEPSPPCIEIRPLTASFRAALIVLNKFPNLQPYFSKEAQSYWEKNKKTDFSSMSKAIGADDVAGGVNVVLLLRLNRELTKIKDEKDVLRYLNWCMLENYYPCVLGEIEGVSDIVLEKFPSLQMFFDKLKGADELDEA